MLRLSLGEDVLAEEISPEARVFEHLALSCWCSWERSHEPLEVVEVGPCYRTYVTGVLATSVPSGQMQCDQLAS